MKKANMRVVVLWVAAFAFLGNVPSAHAIKNFKDQFEEKYVKADSSEPKDVAFREAVDKAKCMICHEGKSKKGRNTYGRALSKLLNKDTDADNRDKIVEALDKVASLKVDPRNPQSPAFGDLIRQGKLPGGGAKR
jgi:hypothetical protein